MNIIFTAKSAKLAKKFFIKKHIKTLRSLRLCGELFSL